VSLKKSYQLQRWSSIYRHRPLYQLPRGGIKMQTQSQMTANSANNPLYSNPVYEHYMADPFVLQHDGHYYAYGTGPRGENGYCFPVLHSTDLVTWEDKGWALVPPGGVVLLAPQLANYKSVFYKK
jgi:hypothetical protein